MLQELSQNPVERRQLALGERGEQLGHVRRVRSHRDILIWGAGRLTDALAEAGLLDEYKIWIFPVIKGEGQPLFRKASARKVELVDTVAFATGSIVHTYRPSVR